MFKSKFGNLLKVLSLLLIFIFSIACKIKAQEHFGGKITDTKGQAVAFAHIQLDKTGIGTVSNKNGDFKLRIPHHIKVRTVNISSIGYLPTSAELSSSNQVIVLREDVRILKEVTITPRDYARELVEKAISRIPDNYPAKAEMHTGFLREKVWWEGHAQTPVYIAESVLRSAKEPYTEKHDHGIVKLLEGRKYEGKALDTLSYRIIGSAHHAHSFDAVARREAFLSNPNAYIYEITDTTRLQNQEVFIVSFKKKRNHGHVYIIDSSFAIIQVNFHYKEFSSFSFWDIGRKFMDYTTSYYLAEDGRYRLKYTNYTTEFDRGKQPFVLHSEYSTTHISSEYEYIPYLDRIQSGEILLQKTGEHDPDFWKDYNISIPDTKADSLFRLSEKFANPKTSLQASTGKSQKIIKALFRLSFSYELIYTPLHVQNYTYDLNVSNINVSGNSGNQMISTYGIVSGIYYRLKRDFSLGIKTTDAFTKSRMKSIDLAIFKDININPAGRPVYITPGLQAGHLTIRHFQKEFSFENSFNINSKKFDSGKMDIYLQATGLRVLPTISIGMEKSHRWQFMLTAGYNMMLTYQHGLSLDETDEFFLKQKKTFVKDERHGLTIHNNRRLLRNSLNLSIGVKLSL